MLVTLFVTDWMSMEVLQNGEKKVFSAGLSLVSYIHQVLTDTCITVYVLHVPVGYN